MNGAVSAMMVLNNYFFLFLFHLYLYSITSVLHLEKIDCHGFIMALNFQLAVISVQRYHFFSCPGKLW